MTDIDTGPTLSGRRVILAPMSASHRDGLMAAASDGELWNLKVTSVPDAGTIDQYNRTGRDRPSKQFRHPLCDLC